MTRKFLPLILIASLACALCPTVAAAPGETDTLAPTLRAIPASVSAP